ncbi:962_t:CDS:2 [Funneliformis geosporum]|nr:962_t:CDS:2 [Funneliformis geosporum]
MTQTKNHGPLDLENVSSHIVKKSEIPKKKSNKNKIIKSKKKETKSTTKSSSSKKRSSVEFVFTVTDFDKEQLAKAISLVKSSNYSMALSILEPMSKQSSPDHEIAYWTGYCYEYLQNYELAEKFYKISADYLLDDGHWEATYGKFLLEHSNLNNPNNKSAEERIQEGIIRLKSSADHKRYLDAMYILGKVYINGLFGIQEDYDKGVFYLKKAYNGGRKDKSWDVYEKKANELVAGGHLKEVPLKHIWAKN